MGRGIAQLAAQAGCQVVLFDQSSSIAEKARTILSEDWSALESKGKLSGEQREAFLSRISVVQELEGLAACDLVIEAVVEDLGAKRDLRTDSNPSCRPTPCWPPTRRRSLSRRWRQDFSGPNSWLDCISSTRHP